MASFEFPLNQKEIKFKPNTINTKSIEIPLSNLGHQFFMDNDDDESYRVIFEIISKPQHSSTSVSKN